MFKVHVLTAGFTTPNGSAFIFPLIKHHKQLQQVGYHVELFKQEKPSLYDCDILLVGSKYCKYDWTDHTSALLAKFDYFKAKIPKVFFCDLNDSSGWPHARVLPHVDGYIKNQLLLDRELYRQALYGHRIYTDYYHQKDNVVDQEPVKAEVVQESALLNKLRVGWNSGLADYSVLGPYLMQVYNKLPIKVLLNYRSHFTKPAASRKQDISCRMGINYKRDTIAWQRRQIKNLLHHFLPTGKISRQEYYNELKQSKCVVSPFGLGEITLKDFETFMAGALLLKPDMSHMQTWPNFFEDGKTIMSFAWDLSDLTEKIELLTKDYKNYLDIAIAGQERYRQYTSGPQAAELFCEHFSQVVS